ncbi:hypothetical protein D7X74_09405 [Corallococcus sp. CA047B]|nr:hypothetical protein D7X74_09405 [Corallococcus sp. CA047B]
MSAPFFLTTPELRREAVAHLMAQTPLQRACLLRLRLYQDAQRILPGACPLCWAPCSQGARTTERQERLVATCEDTQCQSLCDDRQPLSAIHGLFATLNLPLDLWNLRGPTPEAIALSRDEGPPAKDAAARLQHTARRESSSRSCASAVVTQAIGTCPPQEQRHLLVGRTHVPSGRSGWAKAEAALIYEDLGVATVLPETTPSQTRVCFRPELLGPTPSLSRR